MESKHQSGNVLFLILIAVALFAALAYAVTSSTRNSGESVSKDKAKANAAAIVQYATSLRNAVTRIKISNGCSDTTLDFSNNIYRGNNDIAANGANSNAPALKICHVFDPAGGAMSPVVPAADALDLTNASISVPTALKFGHIIFSVLQVKGIGTDDIAGTTSANDLAIVQNYLNRNTCIAINDLLGIPNPGGAPPTFSGTGSSGTYSNGSFAGTGILDNASINGQPAFCRLTGTAYQYVHVMIER